ncbi:MAG: hypothetical protein M0C28_06005 [Candidatus Moduliflexus flocculans]|nr:hypothetical protein [Candidatus Moduliflexus flocculans]
MIVDDIEAEIGKAGESLLVLTGGDDQDEVLGAASGQARHQGKTISSYRTLTVQRKKARICIPAEACPHLDLTGEPGAVLVNEHTLTECLVPARLTPSNT